MKMTIIEAIKHFAENVETYKNDNTSANPIEEWKEEIQYNEQMAEWLAELVKLRELNIQLCVKINTAYDDGYNAGYIQGVYDTDTEIWR